MRYLVTTLLLFMLLAASAWAQLAGRIEMGNRPSCIPAHAYTNEHLTCHMVRDVRSKKHEPYEIPPQGRGLIMHKDIAKYWCIENYPACKVLALPVSGFPGVFEFHTLGDIAGPRGWLQDLGVVDEKGRVYRYWFDIPGLNVTPYLVRTGQVNDPEIGIPFRYYH